MNVATRIVRLPAGDLLIQHVIIFLKAEGRLTLQAGGEQLSGTPAMEPVWWCRGCSETEAVLTWHSLHDTELSMKHFQN